VSKDLLSELAPLGVIEAAVKAQDPPAALQAIASHLELVHGMNVLNMELDRRAVWSFSSPHVEIFVPPGFEIDGVVTIVQVGELWQEVQVGFRVQFGICNRLSSLRTLTALRLTYLSLRGVTTPPGRS
jgi:hypothetical protein